jgi:hypothetical protein
MLLEDWLTSSSKHHLDLKGQVSGEQGKNGSRTRSYQVNIPKAGELIHYYIHLDTDNDTTQLPELVVWIALKPVKSRPLAFVKRLERKRQPNKTPSQRFTAFNKDDKYVIVPNM